jgi:hypothetical protein
MGGSGRGVARGLAVAGFALVAATDLLAGGLGLGALGFVVWGALPYALILVLTRVMSHGWALVGGAGAVLLGELYVRIEVFLFPRGSTAALALLFSPAFLSLIALPAGLGAGWLARWIWTRTGAAAHAALLTAVGLIGLVGGIAYLRPSLLPGPVARFVSAKERIGPPRVVSGAEAMTRTRLAPRPAWYQIGEFEGAVAGDVVAAVDGQVVTLLDPVTGAPGRTIPLGDEARRRWNWFSRLVPAGDELVMAQSGGGYHDAAVLDLSGRPRWSFRPDPSLPASALIPTDLDHDGRPEYYSASLGAVYRLDEGGQVVWRQALPGLVHALDVAPPGGGHPAVVVAVTSARQAHLLGAGGEALATVPLAEWEAYRFTVADWPRARGLVGGVHRVIVLDLEGRPRLQHDLGDFRFHEARAVRLGPGGEAHLAVLAAGPREVGRGRLLIFSPAGAVVYDEILPGSGRLLVARERGGDREALLLAGDGLWRYTR